MHAIITLCQASPSEIVSYTLFQTNLSVVRGLEIVLGLCVVLMCFLKVVSDVLGVVLDVDGDLVVVNPALYIKSTYEYIKCFLRIFDNCAILLWTQLIFIIECDIQPYTMLLTAAGKYIANCLNKLAAIFSNKQVLVI